jgi:hypothetical protein
MHEVQSNNAKTILPHFPATDIVNRAGGGRRVALSGTEWRLLRGPE